MPYKILWHEKALKEFQKLTPVLRLQLAKKIHKISVNPIIPANKLSNFDGNFYKIKLRNSGIRCVYHVQQVKNAIKIIAIGFRGDKNSPYDKAQIRKNDDD